MIVEPTIRPLGLSKRRYVLIFMICIFVVAIPFLYLYATGYKFNFDDRTSLISTGGLFIAADEVGVEIYIDDELVRETRRFTKAFYAQNIDPATHKVHVQKEGFHTWVKELPVYPHLVTEVQAFNLPLVPVARVITRFETATGTPVIFETKLLVASTTESVYATTTKVTKNFVVNTEFLETLAFFEDTAPTTTQNKISESLISSGLLRTPTATTSATTTKEYSDVRLFKDEGDVFAEWIGSREDMPYYYCAEPFEALKKDDVASDVDNVEDATASAISALLDEEMGADELLNPPVQKVSEETVCAPRISLDRKWQEVSNFDFFPGSTDIVVIGRESGVYAVEIDNRSWQNVQPILEGQGLSFRIQNGRIVIYDGTQFYEIILTE
ncbi:hypothetical protein K2X96_03220 [Patescibacteria group bacterium]|nr:hypothetical protein [Patescibacteria group bacterium]